MDNSARSQTAHKNGANQKLYFSTWSLGFSLAGDVATKYLNAQPKKQTPPLMLQS